MKRLVLLGIAVMLVCAAAGTAAPPSVKAIAAARRHAAAESAQKLLREFVRPAHTRLANGRDFHRLATGGLAGEVADAHQFWITHAAGSAVVAFEKAHVPPGFSGSRAESRSGTFTQLVFVWPRRGAASRELTVSVVQRSTRTIIQVDADVMWVYPRSPRERVPSGVAEIDISAPRFSRTVTETAKVRQIVRWFNALPIYPPGVGAYCPLIAFSRIRFTFRDASGGRVASASVPRVKAGICDAITFAIHGKQQTSLVDQAHRHGFVDRVQKLLGAHLLSAS